MNFKKNIIALLVAVNLLLIFMLLIKRYREKFNDGQIAAVIDTSKKNKIHIASKVQVNSSSVRENLKNADLYIDGDLDIGVNQALADPELCIGNSCFKADNLKDFVRYNIPYEVFETDIDIKNPVPDKLCYDVDGSPHCITGDNLRVLNGDQPVYIGGPNNDLNEGSIAHAGHLNYTIGPASQYYYDINDNYFEKEGHIHKENIGSFSDPCNNRIICNTNRLYKAQQSDNADIINASGVTKVPYFYNLNKITKGVTEDMRNSINIDRTSKECPAGEQACNGDGILQMIKMPVHKQTGVNHHFNNDDAHVHDGKKSQDNELMNIAAVNLMPVGFSGSKNNKNVRDKVKYILKPGDDTNLQCFSS
jgi:hypothetical protein